MNIANLVGAFAKPRKDGCLPWLINVLLVPGMVLLLADRAQGQDDTQGSDTPLVQHAVITTRSVYEHLDVDTLADAHLFGAAVDEGESRTQRSVTAPDAALELFLKGIVATDDHRMGYAIIRSADQQEWHFRTGDSVYGLATLEEIHIDRVILRRGGQYDTLRLPIEFMARDTALERARKQEAKRIVSDFRSKLVSRQGMELIKMFGFDTAYRNGGFIGFTVKVMGEDGARMLEVLGVEEGDLITAVNGKRFAESIEAVQSLTELKDATEVDVEIDRNGVPLFFHFDFYDLEQAVGTEEAAEPAIEAHMPEKAKTETPGEDNGDAL